MSASLHGQTQASKALCLFHLVAIDIYRKPRKQRVIHLMYKQIQVKRNPSKVYHDGAG